jgi:hypothetical protein
MVTVARLSICGSETLAKGTYKLTIRNDGKFNVWFKFSDSILQEYK